MIEIQINSLVKSFEVGHNVLDGLTFQIDQGERVGLLGRNGAGKTTLFRILTRELEPDEGQVSVGQGRRLGLISQIPVYPPGCTVEDVLRSAFARLEKRGFIASYQGQESRGRPRTYYTITAPGREYLREKLEEWRETKALMDCFTGTEETSKEE